MPSYRRLKFLVFDAKSLDGMDASGAMSMLKLTRKASERDTVSCHSAESSAESVSMSHVTRGAISRPVGREDARHHRVRLSSAASACAGLVCLMSWPRSGEWDGGARETHLLVAQKDAFT